VDSTGIPPGEALLPRDQDIIDFDWPLSNLDRSFDVLRLETDVGVAACPVQLLSRRIVDADVLRVLPRR
jgi:hypothetical protein